MSNYKNRSIWESVCGFTGIREGAWLALLVFGPAFMLFSRTFIGGVQLWIGFAVLSFIPGYAVVRATLKRMASFEQGLLACFVGLGVTPLLMYYGSVLGVHAVTPWFSVAVAVASIAWLSWNEGKERKERGKGE
jgi:hypothetical protein